MRDVELYRQVLGIVSPWDVVEVRMDASAGEVVVCLELKSSGDVCPHCGAPCPRHDTRTRRWRHLDTCQFRTILEAPVPRVKCREHGINQVPVPWAEEYSRFTALFERLVIDWLRDASIRTVAAQCRMTWHEVDSVMKRAVARGLVRRSEKAVPAPKHLAVDETSYQKRHEYVTVVSDQSTGAVVHVSDDRKADSLSEYYKGLSPEARAAVETVSMDMSKAYISATEEWIPEAGKKIAFDRFHVMKALGDAVDKTRRAEHKLFSASGTSPLKGRKYHFLKGRETLDRDQVRELKEAQRGARKTSRAYAIKEFARGLWHYTTQGWAERGWKKLIGWTSRSRLPHMKKAAATIRNHLPGIITAVLKGITNSQAEAINARIQEIKRRACGFRSRERFRNAIYFHLAQLDLYPAPGNKHWKMLHTDP